MVVAGLSHQRYEVYTLKWEIPVGNFYGVYGKSSSGSGVYGESDSGSAVRGKSPTGYAGDFDGNVRVTGNVGIDATSPAEKLEVSGNVKADKLIYSTPRTHYFVVGGEAFVPGSNVAYTNTYITGGAYIHSGWGTMVAAVHLPQGAIARELKVFFDDNSASDMEVWLGRLILSSGGYNSMTNSVDSSGISGYGNKIKSAHSFKTIDNTLYSYHVKAHSTAWDGDNMKIMGAVITYTLSEAP